MSIPGPTPSGARTAPHEAPAPPYEVKPNQVLLSLFLCLVGLSGVVALYYGWKFLGTGAFADGVATRLLFVLALGLVGAPFLASIFGKVPSLFLVAPTVLLFFLYALFSPYGLPVIRDPIYSFQFARALIQHGTWIPGSFVTNQAVVYSYFPGNATFDAEMSTLTGVPLYQTFLFSQDLFRLLIVPFAVFTIANRLLGRRAALLGVLLYLAIPSIQMNVPTQQDFAVPWLLLSLMAMALILDAPESQALPLRVSVILFSSIIVLDHHLSSYITAGWLGALALLPFMLKGKDDYPKVRSGRVLSRYLLVFMVYIIFVSAPSFIGNLLVLQSNLIAVVQPAGIVSRAAVRGTSYPAYQLGWIYLSLALLGLLTVFVLRRTYGKSQHAFLTINLLAGLILAAITIPFLPTGFNFLALRLMEYSGLVIAPAAAWWIVNVVAVRKPKSVGRRLPSLVRRVPLPGAGWGGVAAVALAFLIFTGGSLVPGSTRDAFAPASAQLDDAPRYIDTNAYAAGVWAQDHLNLSRVVWGDDLAYTVFGGFGDLTLRWGSFLVFEGLANNTNWTVLRSGEYVIVDAWMTRLVVQFPGPATEQPGLPIPPQNLTKFQNPSYFAQVFQDNVFSIYVVTKVP